MLDGLDGSLEDGVDLNRGELLAALVECGTNDHAFEALDELSSRDADEHAGSDVRRATAISGHGYWQRPGQSRWLC